MFLFPLLGMELRQLSAVFGGVGGIVLGFTIHLLGVGLYLAFCFLLSAELVLLGFGFEGVFAWVVVNVSFWGFGLSRPRWWVFLVCWFRPRC